jgi:hypothetical protein
LVCDAMKGRVIGIGSIFGNGSIGEMFHSRTIISMIASSTNILWGTRPILVWTKSIGRITRTCQIGHATFVGYVSRLTMNEFVYSSMRSPVTRSCRISTTIQNVLD